MPAFPIIDTRQDGWHFRQWPLRASPDFPALQRARVNCHEYEQSCLTLRECSLEVATAPMIKYIYDFIFTIVSSPALDESGLP